MELTLERAMPQLKRIAWSELSRAAAETMARPSDLSDDEKMRIGNELLSALAVELVFQAATNEANRTGRRDEVRTVVAHVRSQLDDMDQIYLDWKAEKGIR